MLAQALCGVYTIVDGFFIGHSMGDAGIAAVTIGFPVAQFILSIGTGIGVSGSVRFAILSAQKKSREEHECFTSTGILMLLASLVLTVVLYVLTEPIVTLLGATGQVHTMAAQYVRVIAVGTAFQLLSTGFVPFIRNMGGASAAMIFMGLGFLMNIVLDWLLVWVMPFGMAGAAWATVIAQGVTMAASVIFFIHRRYALRFAALGKMLSLWWQILKVSISPFGLSFSSQFTLIFMNRFLLAYGGERALAAFGCIDYILAIIYLLLQGVGDGSQPLISRRFGERDISGMRRMRGMAYAFGSALTAVCMVTVFILRGSIGRLFGASDAANADVIYYVPWFLISMLPLCFERITTSCLYAVEKTWLSYILVYGEPFGTLLMLLILPHSLGINGVWASIPAAQCLCFIAAVIIKHFEDKSEEKLMTKRTA